MVGRKTFDPDAAVDAAMDAFWEKGYGETSTDDLVARTGLGRGSLYNAFTSKNALFQRALRSYGDRRLAQQTAALESAAPLRERLRAVLEEVVDEEIDRARARRGCLAVNTAMELSGIDRAATREVDRIVEGMREALRATIERGRHDGEIAADRDPSALAAYVLNAMYGLRVLGKVADRRTLTDVVDLTVASM